MPTLLQLEWKVGGSRCGVWANERLRSSYRARMTSGWVSRTTAGRNECRSSFTPTWNVSWRRWKQRKRPVTSTSIIGYLA